ncbi:MAG: EpsG family protein [Bacteroidales bacterium]|nr:EpsG family protein [Bacteroidales bacterium]
MDNSMSISNPYLFSYKSNYKHYLFLFVLWPFLSFIIALANYKERIARNIVYFFLIYYGLTMIVHPFTDSYRYVEDFLYISTRPFSEFFNIVGGLYSTDTSVDIIEPFICFVVSRFTTEHNFLFAAYATVFGFFHLISIYLLYKRYLENPGLNSLIFMIFFITIIPVTFIYAPRMWTAAWMFFYGAYQVVLYRDKRFLLLTLGACFMHWSFMTANVILIIYYFVGNRNYIYFPLLISSFFLPGLLMPVFNTIALRLGGALQNRYSGYTGESYNRTLQEVAEQVDWFVLLSKDLIFYYLLFALSVIYLKYRYLMNEKAEKNLFSFLLLFLSFINFGKSIPSFGDRFQLVFMLFTTLYIFLYYLKFQVNKINLLTLIGLFPMALYIAIVFRKGADYINSWIFLPGFGMPFLADEIPLAEIFFPN